MAYEAGVLFPLVVAAILIVRLVVDAARGSSWKKTKEDLTKKK